VTTENPKAAGTSGEDAASRPHGVRPKRQMSKGMSLAELLALPLMVDVSTAARALGLSRSTGYELARRGEFPCRVLHVGSSYRIPIAELLRVLGIDLSELSPRLPAA
jgi:excisionase family DNA binding protein